MTEAAAKAEKGGHQIALGAEAPHVTSRGPVLNLQSDSDDDDDEGIDDSPRHQAAEAIEEGGAVDAEAAERAEREASRRRRRERSIVGRISAEKEGLLLQKQNASRKRSQEAASGMAKTKAEREERKKSKPLASPTPMEVLTLPAAPSPLPTASAPWAADASDDTLDARALLSFSDPGGARAADEPSPKGSAQGTTWLAEEDTALLAAVKEHGTRWKVIRDVMAHLGTGRSDAMCRNRYARLMAPHRPNVKCTNYCKLCGQLKRGHTCTNASGDPSLLPPSSRSSATALARRQAAASAQSISPLPVKLVEAGRASTISTEARSETSRPPSARGYRVSGSDDEQDDQDGDDPGAGAAWTEQEDTTLTGCVEGLVTKPQALDKALVEFGHQLSPRSLSSIVQRWRCLHRTQALMCPPEAQLDAALPRAWALRALFQRAETLAMATSPRPAAAQAAPPPLVPPPIAPLADATRASAWSDAYDDVGGSSIISTTHPTTSERVQLMRVTVPPEGREKQLVRVEVPDVPASPKAPPRPMTVHARVPDGLQSGDRFYVYVPTRNGGAEQPRSHHQPRLSLDPAKPVFCFQCKCDGCGRLYSTTDTARKHACREHAVWLEEVRDSVPNKSSAYCTYVQFACRVATAESSAAAADRAAAQQGQVEKATETMEVAEEEEGEEEEEDEEDEEDEEEEEEAQEGEDSDRAHAETRQDLVSRGRLMVEPEEAGMVEEASFLEAARRWSALSQAASMRGSWERLRPDDVEYALAAARPSISRKVRMTIG